MGNPRLEKLKAWTLGLLERKLTERHYYHSVSHTLDVAEAAARNAESEGLNPAQRDLIIAAALLHDIGFVECYQDHETRAAEICRTVLPGFGYNAEEIGIVESMILATRLPQQPNNDLERILCDADLDYLGRPDYFALSDRLYREMAAFGWVLSQGEWLERQLAFFGGHRYFLASVRALRNRGKSANREVLRRRQQELATQDKGQAGQRRPGA